MSSDEERRDSKFIGRREEGVWRTKELELKQSEMELRRKVVQQSKSITASRYEAEKAKARMDGLRDIVVDSLLAASAKRRFLTLMHGVSAEDARALVPDA